MQHPKHNIFTQGIKHRQQLCTSLKLLQQNILCLIVIVFFFKFQSLLKIKPFSRLKRLNYEVYEIHVMIKL